MFFILLVLKVVAHTWYFDNKEQKEIVNKKSKKMHCHIKFCNELRKRSVESTRNLFVVRFIYTVLQPEPTNSEVSNWKDNARYVKNESETNFLFVLLNCVPGFSLKLQRTSVLYQKTLLVFLLYELRNESFAVSVEMVSWTYQTFICNRSKQFYMLNKVFFVFYLVTG